MDVDKSQFLRLTLTDVLESVSAIRLLPQIPFLHVNHRISLQFFALFLLKLHLLLTLDLLLLDRRQPLSLNRRKVAKNILPSYVLFEVLTAV